MKVDSLAREHGVASTRELHIRPRLGWIAIDWREIWESRELLYFLILLVSEVKTKVNDIDKY